MLSKLTASYLRRRTALVRISQELRGLPEVPEAERRAVLNAIAQAHTERVNDLGDRPVP
ncbi:MAG TPA: hypothetical protein VG317_09690 [Pseudonocardiaceae bacterium]|nr:hypothetical protein [Pseudonocardiaceae bacterium]